MTTKTRTGMRVIGFGFLLAIITSGSPQAEERQCTGAYRARVVLFFELVNARLSEAIHHGEHYVRIGSELFLSGSTQLLTGLEKSQANRKIRQEEYRELWGLSMQSAMTRCRSAQKALSMEFRDRTIQMVIMLARVRNKYEFRQTVRRLFAEEDFSTGKMAEAFQAHVDRERLLLSYTGDPPELPSGKLERVVEITAGSFGVCQAIRRRNPAHCANIEGNRTECESLAAKVVLQKEGCTDDVIRILSGLSDRKVVVMKKFCEALASQQPEECLAIPNATKEDVAFCRALAGGGETACRDPVFSAAASRDCLFELSIHGGLAGKTPLNAIPDEYMKQELVWPALLAASSDISCDELALGAYDEIVASFRLFTPIFR